MARINVTGKAIVIKSAIKLEDVLTIKKYAPEALTLLGGEDGKEPIFMIGVASDGAGNINQYGATFDATTNDPEGKATVTKILDDVEGDIKEAIADTYGKYVITLNKLEEKLPQSLAEVRAERERILDNITIS